MSDKQRVDVDGTELTLSNLDKPLYPDGFTKGEVIDYYARIAPVMLPHLTDRPATRVRYPDGVDGHVVLREERPVAHAGLGAHRTRADAGRQPRDALDFVVVDDLPTLVWTANLAALELHVPQWRVGPRGGAHDPDLMVFDLDPGPPAGLDEAREVAAAAARPARRGRPAVVPEDERQEGPAPVRPDRGDAPTAAPPRTPRRRRGGWRRSIADLVVSRMDEDSSARARSSSTGARTTGTRPPSRPYSLRAAPEPSVSTPVTWDEIDERRRAAVRPGRRTRARRASTATSSRRCWSSRQKLP